MIGTLECNSIAGEDLSCGYGTEGRRGQNASRAKNPARTLLTRLAKCATVDKKSEPTNSDPECR